CSVTTSPPSTVWRAITATLLGEGSVLNWPELSIERPRLAIWTRTEPHTCLLASKNLFHRVRFPAQNPYISFGCCKNVPDEQWPLWILPRTLPHQREQG